MKIFKVAVTEIYRKVVSVEANNKKEAHQRAWDAWYNTEFLLDPFDDFEAAEMDVLDEGSDTIDEKNCGEIIEGFDFGDCEFEENK